MTDRKLTAIIRKSQIEYVAVCLELNLAARGENLQDVESNLRSAIKEYLKDVEKHPETIVAPISTEEIIEFLQDTSTDRPSDEKNDFILRPLEVQEVKSYA